MSCRSIFIDYYQSLCSDPFWPIKYFSWVYYHWIGSGVICGIIFSGVVIVGHLAGRIFLYNELLLELAKETDTDVAAIFDYFRVITMTLIVPFLVTIWMIRGRRRVNRVISSITTVDEALKKFGKCPSKSSIQWKLVFTTLFPFIFIGGLTWHDTITLILPNSVEAKGALYMFYEHYNELIELYIECYFACFALLLGDRYKAVNSVLKRISEEYSYNLIDTRQVTLDRIITIRELRAVHRELFSAAENISEAFDLQLLIIAIISVISTVGDLYSFYLEKFLICGSLPPYVARYLCWTLMHVFLICVATFCCSRTSAQEKYTAVLLQEISVFDDRLRMEILTFSLQLIHYDLHFSVCGFYTIDLSYNQIVFGTIATYLVIVIQLGSVPHSCRKSSIEAFENITNSLEN